MAVDIFNQVVTLTLGSDVRFNWITMYNGFVAFLVSFLTMVIILAATNTTVGVRYTYIRVLKFLFSWGKERIERDIAEKERKKYGLNRENSESGSEENSGNGRVLYERAHSIIAEERSLEEMDKGFHLSDPMYFARKGITSLIEDEFTKSIDATELTSWNLLTRTNTHYQFVSLRLTIIWFLGGVLRYCILFPFRFILACVAIGLMILGTFLIGYIPDGKVKKMCHTRLALTCYRIMSRSFSAVVTFHNRENRAKGGGICVANHTSPIDIVILGGDNCYSMVGQLQGGLIGIMQRAFSRAESHVWFQREEAKDRHKVARRLQEHANDKNKLPILIFPEGTCISNEHVLQFKKGSFEVGVPIYPIAIKYNPLFADPFWNSSKFGMVKHLALILTSWALVVDIWYLPVTKIEEDENSIHFANRVKSQIAKQGGLVDTVWDGQWKRNKPKVQLMEKEQEDYRRRKGLVREE